MALRCRRAYFIKKKRKITSIESENVHLNIYQQKQSQKEGNFDK